MKIAAVIYAKDKAGSIDALLTSLAARLRHEGYALAGTVQHNANDAGGPCSSMVIEDLATGRMMNVSNPKREASGGCRLDATALEDVAGIVAAGLERPVDLVVVNRFGKQEIIGNGLRALMENAVAREVPLLTAINEAHLAAWDAFAAGMSANLQPEAEAIESWCRTVLPAKA